MIKQISIFTANNKGAMKKITTLMKDNDINITALVTNDSAEFGIVRMIVEKPELAYKTLNDAGYMTRMSTVYGARISDQCGGLDALLRALLDCNINVDYVYISYDRLARSVIAVFDAEGGNELEDALEARGFEMMK
ncbi:MAG: amino acid-binding protein [Eubacteriales bacterium]|nr:amino acid-binding protein [Eubacteriales bacterium]